MDGERVGGLVCLESGEGGGELRRRRDDGGHYCLYQDVVLMIRRETEGQEESIDFKAL